jgi:hypothetical protein
MTWIIEDSFKKILFSQELVVQTCSPSYKGGRDPGGSRFKPDQANTSRDPILKKLIPKKGWWSDSRCKP